MKLITKKIPVMKLKKMIAVGVICLFSLQNCAWAHMNAKVVAEKTTLAPELQLQESAFKQNFMGMTAVLMHPAVNHQITEQIKAEKALFKKDWKSMRTKVLDIGSGPETKGLIVNGVLELTSVKRIILEDLFRKTGQFAHVGLIEKDENGEPSKSAMPVIYIDAAYYREADFACQKHEVDEIIQWEELRSMIADVYDQNRDDIDLRGWIKEHVKQSDPKLDGTKYKNFNSVQIAKQIHDNSFPLDDLYKLAERNGGNKFFTEPDYEYISDLYCVFKDEEGKDVNISAMNDEVRNIPTMSDRYMYSKKLFLRSEFGQQLVFGTSGIRDLVKYLQGIKCYAIAEAILSYMAEMDQPGTIALAGDFRPSTPRIMLTQVMAALKMGKGIVYGGEVPTPAIVNYGMYRADGAVPSAMVTASHCDVLPAKMEKNGIKPNRTTGEVLKTDERRILKHVREFMEIEFMMREKQSMFENNGELKRKNKLSDDQQTLLERAVDILRDTEINDEPRKMYVRRYVDAFGRIFDQNDKMAFVEHMAVGRDVIKKIFDEMGAAIFSVERNRDWVDGLIVDTEDIKSKLAEIIEDTAEELRSENILGVFTTDGDSDRPALFQEDGTFVYGDKLGYLTCEYIKNLQDSKGKKMFVAVTATVSDAVVRRLKDIGIEVGKVKIGSPYVVKAMEDRLEAAKKAGEQVIACGFERNGGFLLGSDIIPDEGKPLKALPTRDSMLPLISAFHMAKKEGKTIGELVRDRFSGKYASSTWSGLIEEKTKDPNEPENDELCAQYTATMGQAIMRSFSPRDLNIVEVRFNPDGSIFYLMSDGAKKKADANEEFSEKMNAIRTILEGFFNEQRGFVGGITKINYLDGVRMFFKNLEVAHMRPSGNEAKWRMYSEATTLKRAKKIIEYKLPIYPKIIECYLKEKEKYNGTRIVPRNNAEMKKTFEGVFDTEKDQWTTWKMDFGPQKEHSLTEGISFGKGNSSVEFFSTRIYNVEGDLEWLRRDPGHKKKLTIQRSIIWDRQKGVLKCQEKWNDGREVSVNLKGKDAWLEVGRGINKNVPMGKFQDIPFPVMSDAARDHFKEQGIYWLDLFDVSVESEFTVEAPMWGHNFKFEKIPDLDDAVKPDVRNALILLNKEDQIPTKIKEGNRYVIKYDQNRLREYQTNADLLEDFSPETILRTYVRGLRMRVSPGGQADKVFDLQTFDGQSEYGPSLISVTCYNSSNEVIGEGHVNIEGLSKNGTMRIIGMLNMALYASHIPMGAGLDANGTLVSRIKAQYKLITGQNMTIEDIRYISLPNAVLIPAENLREYYELTVKQLALSA